MRVLIVDDDRDFGDVLAEEITELGHEVVIARTEREAIETATEFTADVAFVDVLLPDINGVTLAGLLRGAVSRDGLRVIGVSGVERFTLEAASERGIFDGRLAKPVTMAEVQRSLVGHLWPGRS